MVGFYTGDLGSLGVEEQGSDAIPAPSSSVLGAAFGSAFARNPTPRLLPALGEATEQFGALDDYGRPVPSLGQPATVAPPTMLAPADAKARYGIEGVLTFDKPISESVASALYEEKHAEIVRQDTIARRAPGIMTGGFARTATALAAGLLDPINLAAGLVPGFGEARIGAALGLDLAGSLGARVGARAIAGASGGALGMAALEPLNYLLDQREHNDWTMGEAMRDVAFGGVLGGVLHVGLGGAFGRVPANPVERRMADAGAETNAAALRGAVAHVVDDRPVEVAPVFTMEAYHGTPHEFDQFDLAKVGSGEGAQAYGHGLYFAENRGIAAGYRQRLTELQQSLSESDPAQTANWAKHESGISDPKKLAEWIGSYLDDAKSGKLGFDVSASDAAALSRAAEILDKGVMPEPAGHLLTVRLRARPEEMIDWDKPLSEQSPQVRKAIEDQLGDAAAGLSGARAYGAIAKKLGKDVVLGPADNPALQYGVVRGEDDVAASAALSAAGIKGIRYLDQGSRGAGEGSRNVVMFDARDVEITHRNGQPVVPRETSRASEGSPDYLEELAGRNKRQVTADVLTIEQEQIKRQAMLSDPTKLAEYAADKGISEQEMRSQMTSNFQDNVARLEAYRRHLAGMPEDVVARPLAWTELQAEQTEPVEAAFDQMRENAARPPEHPADATAAKANAEAVERAPKVEGPVDEQLAEMTKLKQEAMMAVQAEEAAGRLSADDLAALRAADEETATAEARARAYKEAANCLASRIA